jgi:ribosome-associated translation inhibitor RaiA
MQIRVSAARSEIDRAEIDRIEKTLEKIDRRLSDWREVFAEVRVANNGGSAGFKVTVELEYGRNHLIAKADHTDVGTAVREARDELLRQINDRKRGGHTARAKGT